MRVLPVSAIVPTRNRSIALRKTLTSLEKQELFPAELILVDGSDDSSTRELVDGFRQRLAFTCCLKWMPANICGAASQRNQGMHAATKPLIWFFDDDIVFEPHCVRRLWNALDSDSRLGGVNTMIVNQQYKSPGLLSRWLFRFLNGHASATYAGLVIGPAVNLLPEDRDDLPEVVPVEWLNTTCTLYRRDALPTPPFDSVFVGYSLMEDLTLSLRVGRNWKLANARTARIFHDSQSAGYKTDVAGQAAMELVNRHYVMTEILEKRHLSDYLRLFEWEVFQLAVTALRSDLAQFRAVCRGKLEGLHRIYAARQR